MRKLMLVLSVAVGLVFVSSTVMVGSARACDCQKAKKAGCQKGCDQGCDKKKGDCGCQKAKAGKKATAPKSFDKPPAVGTKATCPVMGSEFVVKADTTRSQYKGKHYVFCCPGCKGKFDANPEKYVK